MGHPGHRQPVSLRMHLLLPPRQNAIVSPHSKYEGHMPQIQSFTASFRSINPASPILDNLGLRDTYIIIRRL